MALGQSTSPIEEHTDKWPSPNIGQFYDLREKGKTHSLFAFMEYCT